LAVQVRGKGDGKSKEEGKEGGGQRLLREKGSWSEGKGKEGPRRSGED
jgi:hypothetical protein